MLWRVTAIAVSTPVTTKPNGVRLTGTDSRPATDTAFAAHGVIAPTRMRTVCGRYLEPPRTAAIARVTTLASRSPYE